MDCLEKTFIGFLVLLLIFFIAVKIYFFVPLDEKCAKAAEIMELPHKYESGVGCFVEENGKWRLLHMQSRDSGTSVYPMMMYHTAPYTPAYRR